MIDKHGHYNGVIIDDDYEVVRYINVTVMNLLDVLSIDFVKLCGKPGYYTFRVDGDEPYEYEFWLKPEGNGLREVPLSLS